MRSKSGFTQSVASSGTDIAKETIWKIIEYEYLCLKAKGSWKQKNKWTHMKERDLIGWSSSSWFFWIRGDLGEDSEEGKRTAVWRIEEESTDSLHMLSAFYGFGWSAGWLESSCGLGKGRGRDGWLEGEIERKVAPMLSNGDATVDQSMEDRGWAERFWDIGERNFMAWFLFFDENNQKNQTNS